MIERYRRQVQLPAVRWKVLNLARLREVDPNKHREQRERLIDLLA